MTIVGRKLLYHRGIDDASGTYITDYVEAGVCLLLALHLGVTLRARSARLGGALNAKPTVAVVAMLFSISMSALLGGLTHQYLQQIQPYRGVEEDGWAWAVVWRAASAFSAPLCFAQLSLAQQILSEAGLGAKSRSHLLVFYGSLTTLCLALTAYCFLMLLDKKDPWSLANTFIVVYIFTLIECAMIVYALVKGKPQQRRQSLSSYGDAQGSKGSERDAKDEEEVERSSDVVEKLRPLRAITHRVKSCRIDLILHLLGAFCFVAAGATQYVLGKRGCADNHDVEVNLCPLPRHFNHNALLHCLTTFALFLTYVAETTALGRRERALSLLPQSEDDDEPCTTRSSSSCCTETSV